MFKSIRSIAMILAMAGAIAWIAPVLRADDSAKGSIKGTVTDADGKPAEGVSVRLFKSMAHHAPAAVNGAAKSNLADAPTTRPTPIAETTTDAQGNFSFADVAVGDYTVSAVLKGVGHARAHASVTSGATASVSLKLAAGQKRPA